MLTKAMWVILFSSLICIVSCQETKSWGNGRFETERTTVVEVGKELQLGCTKTDNPYWKDCSWMTPSGDTWIVFDGSVTDGDGNDIEGVSVKQDSDCGIIVAEVIEDYLGDWRCRLEGEDITYEMIITTADLVTDIRLPKTLDAQHYYVRLIPDFTSTSSHIMFEGFSEMWIVPNVDTDVLTFHADEITPLEVVPGTITPGDLDFTVSEIHFDFQRTFVHVKTVEGFVVGNSYAVRVNFAMDTTRGAYYNYGFYPQICSETNGDPKLCWFTQGESTTARNIFPCLDEPSFKAVWNIEVVRNEDYHARTNYPLVETVPYPEKPGYVLDRFNSGPPMSPYLVAVAITDYVPLPSSDNRTTVWAPADDIEAGRGDYANVVGPAVTAHYENYFKLPYMLQKLDLMYEAKKGGAMENWGLILFAPRTILLDADAGDSEKWLLINVQAHEIAHQV